jgi:glycerol-3-phosphate dehydrogenase
MYDVLIIGGGATGLGAAVDAAARGLNVLLLEKYDFAKGTSSRSTKLIHGGLRYLEQGNLSLVFEALHERGLLIQNAPHLVEPLPFILPCYHFWEVPYYATGLKLYDLLAGAKNLAPSSFLSKEKVMRSLPHLVSKHLRGGIHFYDAQFDDARLAISLMRTCQALGGTLLNYTPVTSFIKKDNLIIGVETPVGPFFAKKIINATGIFTDELRHLDDPLLPNMMTQSQGIHLVLPRHFLPGEEALIIPHTQDQRIMFMIPWHGHVLVGTTERTVNTPIIDPIPQEKEIEEILMNLKPYLSIEPQKKDILSVFAGLRPLVKKEGKDSRKISRHHQIFTSASGLLTITGGKWTTYRLMGEEVIDKAFRGTKSQTKNLRLHQNPPIPKTDKLHPDLPYFESEIIWSIHHEMAKTVDDILSRRTRALFLNANAALESAPRVATLLAQELHHPPEWITEQVSTFSKLAENYLPIF